MEQSARFIWYRGKDVSRNRHAAFRKSFLIENAAGTKESLLHVFADTVYKLYVNGVFVGFGPVRFDPRYPQYDTYDLAPFLRDGKNVIAVLANFIGHKTFKNIPAQAAFIAWGAVRDADGNTVDLRTGVSDAAGSCWKCLPHDAYQRYTPKLSFALPARELYTQAAFDDNWAAPSYNDDHWPDAVLLADDSSFGKLMPREIPFMALSPVNAIGVSTLPLHKAERLYSFELPLPYNYETANDPQEAYSKFLVWSTYIYTPRTQTITAGVMYEEIWVNGMPAGLKTEDTQKPLRYNTVLTLSEGWNYIFAFINASGDIYEGYLALPEGCGLLLSADKDIQSGRLFRHTQIQKIDMDKQLRSISLPWSEDFDAAPFGSWVYTREDDRAESPCREVSWDNYRTDGEKDDSGSFIIRKELYPDGCALLIEMDHMRLLFPCLTLRGVKGATVDLLYGDRFTADGKHLRSLSWVPLGDRLLCAHDVIKWSTVQPRGFRYLNVTIRNAPGDVTVEELSFLSAQYPVTRLGRFECSDPILNQIWEIGATTQSANMEDAFDDCVDRERGLYALDTLIQYHVNLACYGDHKLMKRALEIYGQSAHETGLFRCVYPTGGHYIITDFALYVVNAFYRYYKYTGDRALIAAYWSAIIRNLQVFHQLSDERPDGLLNAAPPAGDWPRKPEDNHTGFWGDEGRIDNTGINCAFSCLYLITLRDAAVMADAVGCDEDAADLKRRIKVLEEAIPRVFWSEEKGLFADNTKCQHFSPHASLLAVKAGVVTPQRASVIRESIIALLKPFFVNGCDPSEGCAFSTQFSFFLLDALYTLDLPDIVEYCIREGWGYFLKQNLPTIPEHFNTDNSQCHAWSASPVYMLSRYVLGISFDAENGLDEVTVAVRPGTLDWAKGAFPHPKGLIEVEWRRVNGSVSVVRAEAPEGVHLRYEG